MNKNKILVAISIAIIITSAVYIISNNDKTNIIFRDVKKDHSYAEVSLVSPENYALVDIPVTVTVHAVTNATNPLIQFTFIHIEGGYKYYYKSLRFSFINNTDISYTPTFNNTNTAFTWYVTVFNGTHAIWYNDANAWHFTTSDFSDDEPEPSPPDEPITYTVPLHKNDDVLYIMAIVVALLLIMLGYLLYKEHKKR